MNAAAGQPLHQQLSQQIRHAIETGVLQPGDLLPGIRTLAETLVVSPNTVAKAYSQLERDRVLELRQGSGRTSQFAALRDPKRNSCDTDRHRSVLWSNASRMRVYQIRRFDVCSRRSFCIQTSRRRSDEQRVRDRDRGAD